MSLLRWYRESPCYRFQITHQPSGRPCPYPAPAPPRLVLRSTSYSLEDKQTTQVTIHCNPNKNHSYNPLFSPTICTVKHPLSVYYVLPGRSPHNHGSRPRNWITGTQTMTNSGVVPGLICTYFRWAVNESVTDKQTGRQVWWLPASW